MNSGPREFDIIVIGATGFTGALVAEYLCENYGVDGELRWAAAGRSTDKLAALKDSLGTAAQQLPLIVADTLDDQSMQELVQRTRVVVTTVGPYARYGSVLVAACATHGTHYCDLAGEVQWIRRMIDSHDTDARRSGARRRHARRPRRPDRGRRRPSIRATPDGSPRPVRRGRPRPCELR